MATDTTAIGDACASTPLRDAGYDPCPGACGDGQCIHEEGAYGVCTWGCAVDCDCWPVPAGGTAPARCSTTLLESFPVCVLDCSTGGTCPSAMVCLAELGICAHPAPSTGDSGTATTDAGSGSDAGSTDPIPPD
ncbi:hypothetical protein [Paraliomyxa miuraensis]|uniref:hypothetical protein n=1 Tax=Paraliomyxa miuraensis TaxID=376150 RepID=UPI00224CECF0|nr:hypothetical protein [Paraliomyxa miuraensis]MCX4242764.1 hypothetical protein [Paraliomyxa miuraensis]